MQQVQVTHDKPPKRWGFSVYEVYKKQKFIGYGTAPNGNRKKGEPA